MKKITLIMALAALVFISACTKEGPVGPSGTNGTNGLQGATGLTGTTGLTGATGTADITSYTASVTSWQTSSITGNYYANITVAGVTQNILDYGAVIVYTVGTNGSGQSYEEAMPHTYPNGASYIDYVQLGVVQINVLNATAAPGTLNYRIVVISGF